MVESTAAEVSAIIPADWPNREASRVVTAGGLRWHVQDMGTGPLVLLIHGTGSANHSWRGIAPILAYGERAPRFRVVAPDLPGHGFTSSPEFARFSLPAMAVAVKALLVELGVMPEIVVGHSAGAAVLIRMALDRYIAPRVIISLNGALLPLSGFPRWIFSPLAQVLARSPFVSRLVATKASNPGAIRRLIEDTGSKLDDTGLYLYQLLVQRPSHVSAALAMMANWELEPLVHDLRALRCPLKLLVASRDRTIPPSSAQQVRAFLPSAEIVSLGDYGHLAHEEQPAATSEEIVRLAKEARVVPAYSLPSTDGKPNWQLYLMQS